eukprot:6193748-Pleurochrysis_carterae.AAC.2
MNPAPLRLVSPSTLLVTYHHHLRDKLPTPDYDYIGGPFYMDSRYGYFVHGQSYGACYWGRVKLFNMDLYALGSIIPSVLISAYYHISSSHSALVMSTLSTSSHNPLLGGGGDWAT